MSALNSAELEDLFLNLCLKYCSTDDKICSDRWLCGSHILLGDKNWVELFAGSTNPQWQKNTWDHLCIVCS